MPRSYRAPNKRIQFRSGGGKFRHGTLADVGMGCCDKCGKIFVPNLDDLGRFVDPREFNARRRTCGICLGIGEPAPKPEPPSLTSKMDEWFAAD